MGDPRSSSGDGDFSELIQHEYDHLDGVLIIDKMSPMDRMANKRAIKELEEAN